MVNENKNNIDNLPPYTRAFSRDLDKMLKALADNEIGLILLKNPTVWVRAVCMRSWNKKDNRNIG